MRNGNARLIFEKGGYNASKTISFRKKKKLEIAGDGTYLLKSGIPEKPTVEHSPINNPSGITENRVC
jgi:hypothetical protein